MSVTDGSAALGLPTADDADVTYNAMMVAESLVEEVAQRVRRVVVANGSSAVTLEAIGAVAAIAADVRLRATALTQFAGQLDAAVFDLDGIRRAA